MKAKEWEGEKRRKIELGDGEDAVEVDGDMGMKTNTG